MGMASVSYGHQTHGFYYDYIPCEIKEPVLIGEHDNAMAPAIYLNKQVDKVAPHKAFNKRGKFKRTSRNKKK